VKTRFARPRTATANASAGKLCAIHNTSTSDNNEAADKETREHDATQLSYGCWPRVRCLRRGLRQAGRVDIDQRLRALGIELPAPMTPVGNYVPAVMAGDLVFVSGTGPVRADGSLITGKVGEGGLSLELAREAARLNGLQILAVLRAELGDLGRVRRVVKVFGMVNCLPGFNRAPAVIDGCSDLLVEVFGDAGRGARSAVGMAELPFDIPVEIEAVVQTADTDSPRPR
jgi:enamine deaminase RidA (YjgF/YER057c/UK114 family)